jgi:hypothetical protein
LCVGEEFWPFERSMPHALHTMVNSTMASVARRVTRVASGRTTKQSKEFSCDSRCLKYSFFQYFLYQPPQNHNFVFLFYFIIFLRYVRTKTWIQRQLNQSFHTTLIGFIDFFFFFFFFPFIWKKIEERILCDCVMQETILFNV